MLCDLVAMPLISELIIAGQNYRIRTILGGKTFRRRMEKQGLQEGVLIQANKTGEKPLPVHLVESGGDVELGEGEAKKLIVEVTAGGFDS